MNLVLYSRQNCSLCDAFEDELSAFIATVNQTEITVKKTDVDTDTETRKRYGNDVPVVTMNDQVICQHFFDREKILKALK